VLKGVDDAEAGVVDPDVDAAKAGERVLYEFDDLFGIRDVARQSRGAVEVADPLTGSFYAIEVSRGEYDGSAFFGEESGDGFPDSHGGSGDNRYFSIQSHLMLLVFPQRKVKQLWKKSRNASALLLVQVTTSQVRVT
jgi:hypothetical protein